MKTLPDGKAIQAGLVILFAVAFPQVIEEGKLYMVSPPRLSVTNKNGERIFMYSNRDYVTYLQKKFGKENQLYRNGKEMDKSAMFDFLLRNERYEEYLDAVANTNVCSKELAEVVVYGLLSLDINEKSVSKWKKLIHEKYSKQFQVEWNDKDEFILIHGIKKSEYQVVNLTKKMATSKKTLRLKNLMEENLRYIFGYDICGAYVKSNISLYQVLTIFNKYRNGKIHVYKGLGEMESTELYETCCNLENQRATKITSKDINESVRILANWHSRKEEYRKFRKEYMLNYEPDIKEIMT